MASGSQNVRAVKGMNDVLPGEIGRWHRVESAFRTAMERLGYREVRTPYVEPTPLFVRAIGEATDVVEKEMYSFVFHDEPLAIMSLPRPPVTAADARLPDSHFPIASAARGGHRMRIAPAVIVLLLLSGLAACSGLDRLNQARTEANESSAIGSVPSPHMSDPAFCWSARAPGAAYAA